MRRTITQGLLVGSLVACSEAAHAYCRSRTNDPPESSCPDRCTEEGEPLHWTARAIEYHFDARGFPGMSQGELSDTFEAAFRRWASVTCAGTTVDLVFTAGDEWTSIAEKLEQAARTKGAQRENIIAHLTEREWHDYGLAAQAYAITQVHFDPATGEIGSADILFNGQRGPFGACKDTGCERSGPRNDLANVATHEIGHFLGLAHSDVPTSTMYCNAATGETLKRDLHRDDADGLCATYPPPLPPEPVDVYRVRIKPNCSALPASRVECHLAVPTLLSAAFAALLVRRRSRVRRSR